MLTKMVIIIAVKTLGFEMLHNAYIQFTALLEYLAVGQNYCSFQLEQLLKKMYVAGE
jgi:hypothetical protein